MKIKPFALERFFDRYEFKVKYLLCSSDCESLAVEDLLALEPGTAEQLNKLWLGYTEYTGHPELRAAITRLYQTIAPEQVIVHTGAEEAIFNFMNAAFEPGDHLIVHFPRYQSLAAIAEANGCEVTGWAGQEEKGWALDLDWLAASIRPTTRAIVINCPHNPTGYQMSRADLESLVEIARRHNLLLFSDEVYRGLEYQASNRLPAACDLYERAVSLGVMSKTYGLAGLRIGWVATRDRELYAKMTAFKDYLSMCNSAPAELLATVALRHHDQLAERNRQIIAANLTHLDDFFARYADRFSWQRPIAGPIAFPALLGNQGAEAFCQQLVEQSGVLLAPGPLFGYDDRHFRLGFGRRNLPQALAALEEHLNHRG